jgi:SanA protein
MVARMGYKKTIIRIATPVTRVLDDFLGIKKFTKNYICPINEIPSQVQYCIVFGAAIWKDNVVSQILQERLNKAIEVSIARINTLFLMTGGDAEVEVMKKYMLTNSKITESLIICDGGGHTTYQSLCRAKEKFGIEAAMAVSNSFHLPRCVFIGRKLGIKMWGAEIPAKNIDQRQGYEEYEVAARIKAWLQTKLPRRHQSSASGARSRYH